MQGIQREQQLELKQMHIEKWRQSGLKMSHYCRQEGIPLSTFSAWMKGTNTGSSITYKRIALEQSASISDKQSQIAELVINDHIKLRLINVTHHEWIVGIIKALMI